MLSKKKLIFLWLLVAGICFSLDMMVKYMSTSTFKIPFDGSRYSVKKLFNIGKVELFFTRTHNSGFLYGIFSSETSSLRSKLVTIISIVILFILLYMIIKHFIITSDVGILTSIKYGFVLGGACGNVFDRLRYSEGVVDCFFFQGNETLSRLTGIFNLADLFIVIAMLLFFFDDVKTKKIKYKDPMDETK